MHPCSSARECANGILRPVSTRPAELHDLPDRQREYAGGQYNQQNPGILLDELSAPAANSRPQRRTWDDLPVSPISGIPRRKLAVSPGARPPESRLGMNTTWTMRLALDGNIRYTSHITDSD